MQSGHIRRLLISAFSAFGAAKRTDSIFIKGKRINGTISDSQLTADVLVCLSAEPFSSVSCLVFEEGHWNPRPNTT